MSGRVERVGRCFPIFRLLEPFMDETFQPIALSADDQFFLSQLLLGDDADATPEQATRLYLDGLIERCGKRWILSAAGLELLLGTADEYPGEIASQATADPQGLGFIGQYPP
jgi:hypothetical protein